MTQGISLFSSTKFTIKATTYPERVNIHKLLQILANLLALLGVSAIVANKYRNNANHLVSYHAWFGLTAMILILIQTFGGLRLLNEMPIIPYNSKIFHIALGLCTYLAGMTTIYLAFYSNWVVHIINLKIVIIFKSATIVLVVLVVSNVIQRMKKKSKPSQN